MSKLKIEAFGKVFLKSSYSGGGGFGGCVGVCIEKEKVTTTNTNDLSQGTIEYTHNEWEAFVQGVKKGEFDL